MITGNRENIGALRVIIGKSCITFLWEEMAKKLVIIIVSYHFVNF